ncbi:hypothetical protein [Hydrogenivirga sp. 128-5-R1-1]|uniref:hypothetical protein n=1 Tax=Hydrogenivirga sp. 128-5-R1-1 TaxID=392423 RepID=UPI00015EF84A|nr:hypothetical protein [Hydrogenivirga sp. 128-5-R1-1]EDP73430.1 hypothetical protein HG1285_07879 [Hydrogenivirga sp. 128-5-R1-1]
MKIFKHLFLVLTLFIVGCGVKGSPKPPLKKTPLRILHEGIKQQGNIIIYFFKTKLLNLDRLNIYLNDKKLKLPVYNIRNFYWIEYEFTEFNKNYCFYIKYNNKFVQSKFKCIKPQKYQKIKDNLKLILKNNGILLKWKNKYAKVNIYKGSSYLEILPLPYTQVRYKNYYMDKNVRLNKIYCYYITATISNIETNRIYSECIKFEDKYPPSPPENLTYILDKNKLTIIWHPPEDEDIIGFIIYKNNKPYTNFIVKSYYFIDKTFKKGDVYQIFSIDKAGNKSKPVYLKIE